MNLFKTSLKLWTSRKCYHDPLHNAKSYAKLAWGNDMVFSLFRKRAKEPEQTRRHRPNRGSSQLARRVSILEVELKKLEDTHEISRRQINRIRMRQIRSETDQMPFSYPLPFDSVSNGR